MLRLRHLIWRACQLAASRTHRTSERGCRSRDASAWAERLSASGSPQDGAPQGAVQHRIPVHDGHKPSAQAGRQRLQVALRDLHGHTAAAEGSSRPSA